MINRPPHLQDAQDLTFAHARARHKMCVDHRGGDQGHPVTAGQRSREVARNRSSESWRRSWLPVDGQLSVAFGGELVHHPTSEMACQARFDVGCRRLCSAKNPVWLVTEVESGYPELSRHADVWL
jgi:hypothetical protein